jgi:isopenicillin N synthase-like dioxygenase
VGFFVIIGHGISDSLIDSVWKSTSNFFDLPTEYKQSYERSQKEYPFGYTRLGGEILSASKIAEKRKLNSMSTNETLDIFHPDMKEMFSLGPDDPKAGFPPRIFPDEPRDFQTT